MWSALVGALLPPLIAVVNQARWPSWGRAMAAVLSSLVAAGITCLFNGELSTADVTHSALVVMTATLAAYHAFWKPSNIAAALEIKTSVPVKRSVE